MQVTIRKYLTGTFVETYEAKLEVPDDIDPDDILNYLEDEGLLDDADWEDEATDDSVDNTEYELVDYNGTDPDEEAEG